MITISHFPIYKRVIVDGSIGAEVQRLASGFWISIDWSCLTRPSHRRSVFKMEGSSYIRYSTQSYQNRYFSFITAQ